MHRLTTGHSALPDLTPVSRPCPQVVLRIIADQIQATDAFNTILSVQNMSLEELFARLDVDDSGAITLDEMATGLKKEVRFQHLPVSVDRFLSYDVLPDFNVFPIHRAVMSLLL